LEPESEDAEDSEEAEESLLDEESSAKG
jgi:hypothetical protein